MYPSTHIIVGGIVSALLLLIFPSIGVLGFAIIFLSSVLIDVDHYLYYSLRYHDWNLKHAYKWFINRTRSWRKLSIEQRNKYERVIMAFHGVECWFILMLLIFVHKIFFYALVGIAIHMILDYIDLASYKEPFYSKTTQLLVIKRNKNKKSLNKL